MRWSEAASPAGKLKAGFFLLIVVMVSIAMLISCQVKNRSVNALYEDVTFSRIIVEARQYISQIEYGIKYGRQLDNFYNMSETLSRIQQCSSYIEGAYIVSKDYKLLYQSGLKAENLRLSLPKQYQPESGKPYMVERRDNAYYVITPIRGAQNQIEGTLILCISGNVVTNVVSEFTAQNRTQSGLIALEMIGIALLAVWRLNPQDKKKLLAKLMKVLSVCLIVALLIDSGVVLTRYYQIANEATRQTADKMAQAIQSDVDNIINKGVSLERVYDINSWLEKKSSEVGIVTSLTIDENHKITANVSKSYINAFLWKTVWPLVLLLIFCVVICAAGFIYIRFFLEKYAFTRKIISVNKEVST